MSRHAVRAECPYAHGLKPDEPHRAADDGAAEREQYASEKMVLPRVVGASLKPGAGSEEGIEHARKTAYGDHAQDE